MYLFKNQYNCVLTTIYMDQKNKILNLNCGGLKPHWGASSQATLISPSAFKCIISNNSPLLCGIVNKDKQVFKWLIVIEIDWDFFKSVVFIVCSKHLL